MSSPSHVLISLEERHAQNILSGAKLVELRRRAMSISSGSTVWLYAKVPVGSIVGFATVKEIHHLSPTAIWERFGSVSGLSRRELYKYFEGIKRGCVLELTGAKRTNSSLSLKFLRGLCSNFQPPQFFAHIPCEHPIYEAVISI